MIFHRPLYLSWFTRSTFGRAAARLLIATMALSTWPLAQAARAEARVVPLVDAAEPPPPPDVVFGPKDYVRRWGSPVDVTEGFAVGDPAGFFTLRIENGGSLGQFEPVSSALVEVNGVVVVSPEEFHRKVLVYERPITLDMLNAIHVRLDNGPGKGFSLHIYRNTSGNRPPVAHAGSDRTAQVGQLVQLDGSRSFDLDGHLLTYRWVATRVPPSSHVTLSDPGAVRPTFTPDRQGWYEFELSVNDGVVDSTADRVTITTAANATPVANAGPDQTADAGDTVTLDGSASSDADGDALTYRWRFVSQPAGSTAALSDPAAVSPTLVVDQPGAYVAELIVNDGTVDSAPDLVRISTGNSAPVANAGADQTVPVGATVTLDGRGSSDADGDPLTYLWALTARPAGSTAALSDAAAAMPTFDVDEPGEYIAQLIVNDGTTNSAPDTVVITTVNSAPVANAGPDQSARVGDTVTLDGSGSSDVDGDALTYQWALAAKPGGSAAALSDPTAVMPTFVIDLPGVYVAQLIVNDGTVNSVPDTSLITTENSAPVANAGADQSVHVGDQVTLDGSGSTDVDGDALAYLWSLSTPAGSAAALSDPSAVKPTFVVDVPGLYIAQLIVNDGTVGSAPDTATITTVNSAPVANAGADQTAAVGGTVTLDGSGSSDADGDALTYHWSLTSKPAGSAAALSDPVAVMPTFVIDLPGTYVAQLIVNDGTVDSAPDTVRVTTVNSPPVAHAGADQSVFVGDTVTLDGSGSTDVDGDALTYLWSLTSRPAGSAAVLSDPAAVMPTFVVDVPGTYVAQLIVNDGIVNSAPDTVMITTANSAPVANAGPDQSVLVGATVTLDGTASSDADGDALTYQWSFTARPAGSAAVLSDPSAASPTFLVDAPGAYVLQLIVNDGTVDSAPDTVAISTINSRPVANAGGDQLVLAGATVQLDGTGSSDADNDALTYRWALLSAPAGSLAALSDPNAPQPTFAADVGGVYVAQLIVNDGTEDSAPDTVTITARVAVPDVVGQPQADAEAEIAAAGLVTGVVRLAYHATVPAGDVISQDPVADTVVDAGDAVDLVVSQGPEPIEVPDVVGMLQADAEDTIEAEGFVVGAVTFENHAMVPAGRVIRQSPAGGELALPNSFVDIVVSLGVGVPVLTSITVTPADATIARGDVLQFTATGVFSDSHTEDLTASATWQSTDEAVAIINAAGLANGGNAGSTTIRATHSGITGSTSLSVAAAALESIVVTPANPVILVGQTEAFTATGVLSDGTSTNLAGQVTWASSTGAATINAAGVASGQAAGPTSITATKDGIVGTAALTVQATVADPTPPTAAITAPANNAFVVAQVNVVGTANDANFSEYILDFALAGSTAFTTLATGAAPVINGVLGSFNPTVLLNDLYTLRLRVFDRGGNVTTASVNVQATKDQKVGLFTMSFEDVQVPMSGVPLVVNRVYDSREKASGDFGFGWRLELQSIKLRANRVQGTGWQVNRSGGFFPTYTLVGTDQHKISVTLPTGKVEEFDLTVTPSSSVLFPLQFADASYTPRAGTHGTLTVLSGTALFITGAQPGPVELLDDFSFDTFDPTLFRYTAGDGTQLVVSKFGGVQSITDLNGNTLTIGPGGLTHSAGRNVTFARDGQGRITRITDPNNNVNQFAYDLNGDLASHTDPLGHVTRFFYNLSHGLIEVRDPRGLRPLRNEYDDEGRLVATIDAAGHRMEYTHNTGASQEVTRDRRGNVTVVSYDAQGLVLSRTDALGRTESFSHDARGNELTRTDKLGHLWQKTFDARDAVLTEVDPLGRAIAKTFNARGQVLTETDRNGNVTTNTYDGNGNETSSRDQAGRLTQHTYNGRGDLLTTTDSAGRVTQHTYDGSGRRTSSTDTLERVTTFTYDANGNRLNDTITATDGAGGSAMLVTRREYDGRNRLLADIDPAGNATRFEFNSIGREAAIVDRNGNRTTFDYDARGNRVRANLADGTTELMVYDEENNLIRFTDRGGRVTTHEYDALNRRTKTIHPDGSQVLMEYDAVGQMTAVTNERGHRTTYEYDAAGRKTAIVDPLGNRTTHVYSHTGKVLSTTDANTHTTAYQYDPSDKLTRTTYHDTTTKQVGYDAMGRKASETDQLGRTKTYEYDVMGRLTAVVDAEGGRTTFTYDEAGRRLMQTDARGNATRFAYDAAGGITRRTLPLGMFESFTYDGAGNPLTRIDYTGRTTTYAYDAANRLVTTTYGDGTSVAYTYTPTGKRLTATDGRGVTTYAYDVRDRLTRVTHPGGEQISYTYDATGNVTSVTTPGGTTTSAYDALNRLISVTDARGGVTTYAYDAVGNRGLATFPNGTSTAYTYDALNRLTNQQHLSGGAVVANFAYGLDAAGRRVSLAEATGRSVAYGHDLLSRLTTETIADVVLGNHAIAYTYDAVGNRLTKTDNGITTNYGYDANDRLLNESGILYEYDDNGNMLRKTTAATTTHFQYDFENRLVRVDIPGTTTYAYDADGVRVSANVNGTVTNFLVDTNQALPQVLEETDGAGALVVSYTVGDDLISQTRAGMTSHFHFDGHGSTRLLSDDGGVATDTYTYDAFGVLLNSTGTTINRYLYNAQQFDVETGFYYLRARYYNPALGRFLTMDPATGSDYDPPSLHKYLYANADPVNMADPAGLFAMAATAGIAISFPLITISWMALLLLLLKLIAAVVVVLAATCGVSLAFSAATGGAGGVDPCRVKGRANMFYPGNDTPETTQHIRDAISFGQPALLHRGPRINWNHRGTPACLGNVAAVSGLWCDEYPFGTTREGGPGASTRLVPAWEQALQGGYLSAFYSQCRITTSPPDDAFAVGPTPAPATAWVCRR